MFKGTVSVICDLPSMSALQQYPLNLCLVKDFVDILIRKLSVMKP